MNSELNSKLSNLMSGLSEYKRSWGDIISECTFIEDNIDDQYEVEWVDEDESTDESEVSDIMAKYGLINNVE